MWTFLLPHTCIELFLPPPKTESRDIPWQNSAVWARVWNDRLMKSKSPIAVKMCALLMVQCPLHLTPEQHWVYVHISTLFLSDHKMSVEVTLPSVPGKVGTTRESHSPAGSGMVTWLQTIQSEARSLSLGLWFRLLEKMILSLSCCTKARGAIRLELLWPFCPHKGETDENEANTVVLSYSQFPFPQFQFSIVNCGLKTLNGKFQK